MASKTEALEEIEEQLADVQMRSQGFADWKGEPDLQAIAEDIYAIARQAEEPAKP